MEIVPRSSSNIVYFCEIAIYRAWANQWSCGVSSQGKELSRGKPLRTELNASKWKVWELELKQALQTDCWCNGRGRRLADKQPALCIFQECCQWKCFQGSVWRGSMWGKPEEAAEQYTCETNTGRQTPVLWSFVLSRETIRFMETRLLQHLS